MNFPDSTSHALRKHDNARGKHQLESDIRSISRRLPNHRLGPCLVSRSTARNKGLRGSPHPVHRPSRSPSATKIHRQPTNENEICYCPQESGHHMPSQTRDHFTNRPSIAAGSSVIPLTATAIVTLIATPANPMMLRIAMNPGGYLKTSRTLRSTVQQHSEYRGDSN